MAKFPEAMARMFHHVYVCRNCKQKVKSTPQKVINKTVLCKRCGGRAFRPIKSKK